MKADTKTETAVKAVMKEFAERYAQRDLAGVLALHASDPDVVVFSPEGKSIGIDEIRAIVAADFSTTLYYGLTAGPPSRRQVRWHG